VRRRLVLLLCLLVPASALAIPGTATAADELFLQVPGVQGESSNLNFVNAIVVTSFSWGVANPIGGRAQFSNFQFTKRVDTSSPQLLQLVANKQVIPSKVTLSVVKAGTVSQVYRAFCFTGVRFTSLQSNESAGDDGGVDSVSFSYGTVVERYSPQNADGSLGTPIFGGWDVFSNVPFSDASC
jgi:type VI secretion system secreted protein Hcp